MIIPHKLSGMFMIVGFLIFFVSTLLWNWKMSVLGLVLMWIGFGIESDALEHERLRYSQHIE